MDDNEINVENSPITNLKNALEQLYASKELVQGAFSDVASQDLSKENEKLREYAKILAEKLENSEKILSDLKNDHALLEKNFKEELNQKKVALIYGSESRMQKYLSVRFESETMRLDYLQAQLAQKLEYMLWNLKILDSNEQNELQAEIDILTQKINYQAEAAKKRAYDAWAELLADKSKTIEEMQNAEIDGNALRAVRNFFKWETFFGLRLISSLGVLLIVIGVFTFGGYVYIRMSNEAQCACIFAIGLIFLAVGEILNKKWRGVFSLALTAGGLSILFLATALGHLTLKVLPMQAALVICAAVSVVSFALSIRHNSQTISIFALIGGYLPVFALNADSMIWAVIYFTILNLFSLALATRKNWKIARFVGLFAGILAEYALYVMVFVFEYYVSWNMTRIAVKSAIAVSYCAYLAIPVFGAWFTKTKIKAADIVLLVLNIFFRFLLALSSDMPIKNYNALVCAFFALTCICMAFLSERGAHKSVPDKDKGSIRALFFFTSVTFSALTVLFWFDKIWFSSGWLIEGAGLFLYGILRERKRFTIAGSVVGAVCATGFVLINVINYSDPLFVWQYLLMTLGLISSAIALAIKKIPAKYPEVQFFQACAAINAWIFVVYLLFNPVGEYLSKQTGNPQNIIILACIVSGMLYSYILPKIRAVYCTGIHAAGILIGSASIMWLFVFNALFTAGAEITLKAITAALYIMANLLSVFWMRDLMQFLILKKTLPIKFYPLFISGYFVALVSQNLVVQFALSASSMILTLIFAFTALGWIIFGFAKRNSITRVWGLGLSFTAVIKLFVLDLWDLSTELKIVSYFIMGALLLAISFIYQYFTKRLKESEEQE